MASTSFISILACILVLISSASGTLPGPIKTPTCYSFRATAFFILDPNNPGQNTFAVGPNESTLPPYRNGAGFTFTANINSSCNTKATYRGVFFITSNLSLSHLTAELEFLPGSAYAGSLVTWSGKVDFVAGMGTYGVTGGRGEFEGAIGSVTEQRLTQALSGESWLLHADFCIPVETFLLHKNI